MRRSLGTTLAAAGLCLLTGPAVVAAESTGAGARPQAQRPQTSDGLPGLVVADVPRRAAGVRTGEVSYEVAPGLQFEQWDQADARGPVRAYLLTADLATPGLRLEYASTSFVRKPAVLSAMLARQDAVAGVNGDFFDIGDTSAPLGVGVSRGVVRNGPRSGWTRSFLVFGKDDARIRRAPVRATVVGRPGIKVTNVNSPQVPVHGIGLYTPAWGKSAGRTVVEGARRRDVRQVVVREGRVVSNGRRLSAGEPVRGRLLVGRGRGAVALAGLKVGQRVRFAWSVEGSPRVAISGSDRLLRDGEVLVTDDRIAHPRTAVGIDDDTGEVLLLVVDGRQEHSRGLTLVELAELLLSLGAEQALNLDGGGSSTMVARDPLGTTGVVNLPSAGEERRVPNGLALTYEP